MPVSHELRCIHIHIPRTGGTSVEHALGTFHNWKDENRTAMFGLIQSADTLERVSVSRFLQHVTALEARAILPVECADYFSFAFVRNPWDRMVSIFHHKDPNLVMHAAAAGIDVHALSFGDFVEITRDLTHVHLVPQITFVSDERGGCTVDFIGRFERLAQDFAVIKSRLGIDVELAWHNRSNHDHYRSYYCDHTRRLVGDLYRKDVEAFGYEF